MKKLPSENVSPYYRWELLALLFCAYFLHQADRAIFGVVLSSIKAELNLSDTTLGFSATILFLVTAVMVPVAGFLGDRWSKKWIITCSLVFWSISTMLTGTVRGIAGIIAFRSVATGGSEAFYGPSSTALIAAYHKKTRALALSIHQASLYTGIMLSGFLAGWISLKFGWRSTFYLFGGLGVFLGLVFVFRLRDAPKETVAQDSKSTELKETVEQPPQLSLLESVLQIVQIRSALLLVTGFTAIVFVNNAYLTWAPMFFENKFELTQFQAGGYSMLYHHLAALVGVLLGGSLSDWLVPRFPRFRLGLQSTAMLIGAVTIFLIGYINSLAVVWVLVFLFGFVRGLYESNTHAAMFDVVPARLRSTVVGLMIMVAFLIGSFSPLILGALSERFGPAQGLSYGFMGLSAVWLIGATAMATAFFTTFLKDRHKRAVNEGEISS